MVRIYTPMKKVPFQINNSSLTEACMNAFNTGENEQHEIGEVKTLAYRNGNKLVINDFVMGTYAEEFIKVVNKLYYFSYARIRKVDGGLCYGYHTDEHGLLNIHVPLSGDFERCFMIIDDELFKPKLDGCLYIFDGSTMHTAINSGNVPRFHLHFEASIER